MSTPSLNQEISLVLNRQLFEIFGQMNHPRPFKVKLSVHGAQRVAERIMGDKRVRQFANLIRRIVTVGLCELLYYQARYINGESIQNVEFVNDDLIVPISFVGDYVVLRTVMIKTPGSDREGFTAIDVSDDRVRGTVIQR